MKPNVCAVASVSLAMGIDLDRRRRRNRCGRLAAPATQARFRRGDAGPPRTPTWRASPTPAANGQAPIANQ
jgi:hypothetical protein